MNAVLEAREPSARYLAALEPALLGQFDLIAQAPNGVARLRELILSLAVQGKLVPQDPNDEPASLLLERIRAEKARLFKEGKIRKDKPLATISEDENPFVLPAGWEWARLGELGYTQTGTTPDKKKEGQFGSDVPFIKPADIYQNFVDYSNEGLSLNGLTGSSRLAPSGSILMVCIGTIGKCNAIATDCSFNQQINSITPICMSSQFTLTCLRSTYFQAEAWARSSSTTIAILNKGKWESIPVPLAPLSEQSRIVARVEELMALCDTLEAKGKLEAVQHVRLVGSLFDSLASSESAHALAENWQRIATHFDLLLDRPAAVDALEQTILQLAVRGLLVPQDPTDEPASALMQKIRNEKDRLVAAGKIKRDKTLPLIRDEDKPFELPEGWEWARFPELGEFGRGKSKHRPRNDPRLFNPGKYPLVQTGEVARADQVIREYHSKYSEEGLAQSKMWPEGTLCITIAANIADTAMLGFDACFPDSVVGFVPSPIIGNTEYFLAFMATARERLLEFAPATAQKNINLEILSSVLIPIPPVHEMKEIVSRITELRTLCSDLRQRVGSVQQTQSRLAEALVESVVA